MAALAFFATRGARGIGRAAFPAFFNAALVDPTLRAGFAATLPVFLFAAFFRAATALVARAPAYKVSSTGKSVMAPLLPLETSFMYLANRPRV